MNNTVCISIIGVHLFSEKIFVLLETIQHIELYWQRHKQKYNLVEFLVLSELGIIRKLQIKLHSHNFRIKDI